MNQTRQAEPQELLLQNLALALWRRKLLIVLTTAVALAAALLLVEEPPAPPAVFEAKATMVVDLAALGSDQTTGVPLPGNAAGDRSVQTQIRLMTSKNVMDRAAAKVLEGESDVTEEQVAAESAVLQASMSVTPVFGTNMLELTVKGADPTQAKQRANAIINGYVEYVRSAKTKAIEDALASTRKSIQTASGDEPSVIAAGTLVRLSPELEAVSHSVGMGMTELATIETASEERAAGGTAEPGAIPFNAPSVGSLVSSFTNVSQELRLVSTKLTDIQHRYVSQAGTPISPGASNTAELLRASAESAQASADRLNDAATLLRDTSPLSAAVVKDADAMILESWWEIDVLARQVATLSSRVESIPLGSELATLGTVLSAHRTTVQNSRVDLSFVRDELEAGQDGTPPPDDGQPTAHIKGLRSAQALLGSVLKAIDGTLSLVVKSETGEVAPVQFTALEDSAARLGAAKRNLDDAASLVGTLRATAFNIDESTQLLVVVQRLQNTTGRLGNVVDQMNQSVSRPDGVDRQELLKLEQKLEIDLLQPQETGLSIVDPAVATRVNSGSTSSSPLGVDMRIFAAAMGGFLVGVIGALAMEFVDRRVRTPERLRTATGLAVLGQVPKVRHAFAAPTPATADMHMSAFDAAMRLVTDQVLSGTSSAQNAILLTSANRGEGKTVLGLNMARLSARAGFKTLFIDADFQTQGAAARLGVTSTFGLSTALRGLTTPGSSFVSIEPDLDFMPSGEDKPVEHMSQLSSPAMVRLLTWATDNYDRVYLDCPPIIGHAETILMARQVGNVLLVVDSRRTMLGDVQQAKEAAFDVGAMVMGCVLNFVPSRDLRLAGAPDNARRWFLLPRVPGLGRRQGGETSTASGESRAMSQVAVATRYEEDADSAAGIQGRSPRPGNGNGQGAVRNGHGQEPTNGRSPGNINDRGGDQGPRNSRN